ncbi:MAG TPA: hypothetical protein DCM68_05250 [Verrucomicrobia bacterium]|nr:hypothetical protein [Verrucomicrobiota bacterium]
MNTPSGHPPSRRSGFTIVEVMVAAVLLGLVLTASTSSLVFVLRNERIAAAQADLDLDASLLVERLRADLWRTSRSEILLYPPGDGPYQAISFPVVHGTNPIIRDAITGQIPWDATIVYHKELAPSQVLRTEIPSYDPDPSARESQLADVVTAGSTYTADSATTRVLIKNPVQWELNVNGTGFDAYSSAPSRGSIRMGRAMLEDGDNEIQFRVSGQNSASSGYRLGVDTLAVTASGLPREGEWQTLTATGAGPVPIIENLGSNDLWSGNSRLGFPATAEGNAFTMLMENDRWEERNFFGDGMKYTDVVRDFIAPSGEPFSYALRLAGNGTNWLATDQARCSSLTPSNLPTTTSMAVRVFLRGSDITEDFDGGWITASGSNIWARFDGRMKINEAFIAEANTSASNLYMDYLPATRQDFLFGGSSSTEINWLPAWGNGIKISDKTAFTIDKDKSYIVGIHFSQRSSWLSATTNLVTRIAMAGPDAGPNPSCFYIMEGTEADQDEVAWSSRGDVVATTNIWVLTALRAGYASEGIYVSQIIDTQLDNPAYESFDWTALATNNSAIELKVRAGAVNNLSDADDWSIVPLAQAGLPPGIYGRYAQVQARLLPGTDALITPELRDFTLAWAGGRRYVDLSGIFSTGPDHGVYEVRINGHAIVQEINAYIEVIKDYSLSSGQTMTMRSSAFAEIVPRN